MIADNVGKGGYATEPFNRLSCKLVIFKKIMTKIAKACHK